MLRRLVAVSGRPMTTTILERDSKPQEWRRLLGMIADANAAGLPHDRHGSDPADRHHARL